MLALTSPELVKNHWKPAQGLVAFFFQKAEN